MGCASCFRCWRDDGDARSGPRLAGCWVMQAMMRFLFPREMRPFPYRRPLLNLFRALHILCLGIYLGGLYFGQDMAMLSGWYYGIVISGLGLLLVDLYSSCMMLFEVRGITVLTKLIMLLSLPLFQVQVQIALLVLLIFLSSLVAHASRNLRHRNLLPASWQARLGVEPLAKSRGVG